MAELSAFWKDHSIESLCNTMRWANKNHPDSPHCTCISCICLGRHDGNDENNNRWNCIFKPWFEEQIASCGMDFHRGTKNQHCIEHKSASKWVVNLDAHFVSKADKHLTSQTGAEWDCLSYGNKLYNASSVDDVELRKLERLFAVLQSKT